MNARVLRFEDPAEFQPLVEAHVMAHEGCNNQLIGLTATLIRDPAVYPEPPLLAVVEEEGKVIGAALRTPPHNLVISVMEPRVAVVLAHDFHASREPLPGLLAPNTAGDAFVKAWESLSGQPARVEFSFRAFELETVTPGPRAPGRLRSVEPADRDLLARWTFAFRTEAMGDPMPDAITAEHMAVVDRRIAAGNFYLWDHDGPVSMAAVAGLTERSARIVSVYTPPELRGHGYASACVAALSRKMLDDGRSRCFLLTDITNPTSNHIYQEIGYHPVCDLRSYIFGAV